MHKIVQVGKSSDCLFIHEVSLKCSHVDSDLKSKAVDIIMTKSLVGNMDTQSLEALVSVNMLHVQEIFLKIYLSNDLVMYLKFGKYCDLFVVTQVFLFVGVQIHASFGIKLFDFYGRNVGCFLKIYPLATVVGEIL